MKPKSFNIGFAQRLRELMIQRGYASHTASSGVSPTALCKAIGCFTEMALRYLDGRSVPNPETVLKIAHWLNVDPGYLLFGAQEQNRHTLQDQLIHIDKKLLEYALKKIGPIIKTAEQSDEVLNFFISVLTDLSQMDIEYEDLLKIFDLTIKSSTFFAKEPSNNRDRRCATLKD